MLPSTKGASFFSRRSPDFTVCPLALEEVIFRTWTSFARVRVYCETYKTQKYNDAKRRFIMLQQMVCVTH